MPSSKNSFPKPPQIRNSQKIPIDIFIMACHRGASSLNGITIGIGSNMPNAVKMNTAGGTLIGITIRLRKTFWIGQHDTMFATNLFVDRM